MDGKTLQLLIDAGAVKQVFIVANGSTIHVEVQAGSERQVANTSKGALKTWRTIDSAEKWVRSLGVGKTRLDIAGWKPDQKVLNILKCIVRDEDYTGIKRRPIATYIKCD
jgi:hypothetical protein